MAIHFNLDCHQVSGSHRRFHICFRNAVLENLLTEKLTPQMAFLISDVMSHTSSLIWRVVHTTINHGNRDCVHAAPSLIKWTLAPAQVHRAEGVGQGYSADTKQML